MIFWFGSDRYQYAHDIPGIPANVLVAAQTDVPVLQSVLTLSAKSGSKPQTKTASEEAVSLVSFK
jgi:hypothetical protein